MLKVIRISFFLSLALTYNSCSKKCEECSDEYKLHFNFRNSNKEQIYKNIDLLTVTDPNNNPLTVTLEVNDGDSLYQLSLDQISLEDRPDTIIFMYNNQVIDIGGIDYGYQRDNECCNNPRVIEGLDMLHLTTIHLIKSEYDIFSIIVG